MLIRGVILWGEIWVIMENAVFILGEKASELRRRFLRVFYFTEVIRGEHYLRQGIISLFNACCLIEEHFLRMDTIIFIN